MSTTKRKVSTSSENDGKMPEIRARTSPSDTPIEQPVQDVDKYRSVTLNRANATEQEFKTVLSILETPSLASQVMEVCFYGNRRFTNGRPDSSSPYEVKTETDIRAESLFRRVIAEQQWPPEDADRLFSALMRRNTDAMVAVLLPMCPNAEHLALGEINQFIPTVVELMDMPAPAYAITATHLRLKTCFAIQDSDYSNYSFETFDTYARLPRLTHLAMSGIGGIHVEDAASYEQIPKYSSAVKNITIKKSQLGTECLLRIIKFAKKDQLESFTYHTGGMVSPDTSGAIIELPLLWAALTHHTRTLRKLDLDIDSQITYDSPTHYPGDSNSEEDSETDDVELEHPPFQNLTCLRIGIDALMMFMVPAGSSIRLVNVLPHGLEELVVRGYDKHDAKEELDSQLDDIKAQMGTGRLSKLRILQGIDDLIPNGEDYDGDEDEWEDDGTTEGDKIWT